MSRHLSPEEFIDAIEGALPATRRDHIDRCAQCRNEVEALRTTVADAQPAAEVPPASPLFWDHFAGRVRAAAHAEGPQEPRRWWRLVWPAATAAAALVVLAAVPFLLRSMTPDVPVLSQTVVESAPSPIPVPAADEIAGMGRVGALEQPLPDESSAATARSWTRMVTAGRGVSPDEVLSVAPSSPATAVLVEDLSPRELQEFARLLRAQMGGVQ
jgi:hypothetical protein